MYLCSFLIAVLVLYGSAVCGYDLMSCKDMLPNGISEPSQMSRSPYAVTVSPTVFQDGVPVTVTLAAVDGTSTFSHFLIQALCVTCDSDVVPVGTFTNLPAGTEILPCSGTAAAVLSTSNDRKNTVKMLWTPPKGFDGIVVMRASVVQSSAIWWRNIASRAIEGKEVAIWWQNEVARGLGKKAPVVKRQAAEAARPRPRTTTITTTTEAPGSASSLSVAVGVNLLAFAVTFLA